MDRAAFEEIAGQLRGLLIRLDDRLSAKDATLIAEFIDVGELGLARPLLTWPPGRLHGL